MKIALALLAEPLTRWKLNDGFNALMADVMKSNLRRVISVVAFQSI